MENIKYWIWFSIFNFRPKDKIEILRVFDNKPEEIWKSTKEDIYKKFLDRMKELNIDIYNLHVSGHADYTAFNQVIEITKPNAVIPMHTENKEKIKDFTDKAVILEDMETYTF